MPGSVQGGEKFVLSYESVGNGARAVVFLHGFGGSRCFWRQQVAEFSLDSRCVVIDLPGHGDSAWAPSTLADMAGQVASLLKENGAPRVHLVASSFGGLVALEVWRQWPRALSTITLVGSVPRFIAGDGFPAGLDVPRIRKLAGQFEGDLGTVLDMFFRSLFTLQERTGEPYADIKKLRHLAPLPRREALLAMLDILEEADLRDLFVRVDVPVQIVGGTEDYICPPAVVGVLKKMKPSLRVDLFADCGHFPFLTQPWEFNRVLRDFWEA